MRRPINSLKKVPGHLPIAAKTVSIIRHFLKQHPKVAPSILESIGVSKEELERRGFRDELDHAALDQLREEVAGVVGANLEEDTNLTELIAPLFGGWIRSAGDPDVPLGRWLHGGAPAGITAHRESVGIFPVSEAAPSQEFELALWQGGEVNYTSMDESPFADGVLQQLVDTGYIKKISSI